MGVDDLLDDEEPQPQPGGPIPPRGGLPLARCTQREALDEQRVGYVAFVAASQWSPLSPSPGEARHASSYPHRS
jgi:hypothetical protein